MEVGPSIQHAAFMKSIHQGTTFRMKGDKPFPSSDCHVFIILSYDCDEHTALCLVNGTTRIEKRLHCLISAGIDINSTVVRIAGGIYPFFPKETMIDCNNVHLVRITAKDFEAGNITALAQDISAEDFAKIRNAVLSSRMVSAYKKSLIMGPAESI